MKYSLEEGPTVGVWPGLQGLEESQSTTKARGSGKRGRAGQKDSSRTLLSGNIVNEDHTTHVLCVLGFLPAG